MEEKKGSPKDQLPEETLEWLTESMKSLSDRAADKRKQGIAEMEKLMKSVFENRQDLAKPVLTYIKVHIIENPASRLKKAGLLAFGSICCLVMDHVKEGIKVIMAGTIKAMGDDDLRVRFAACEAMYNILNSCRSKLIDEICFILDNIIKLLTDASEDVRKGVSPLDYKLKEIVKECLSRNQIIDMKSLVSLLCDRMNSNNESVRNLLVSWLELLCSIPNVNILNCVPMLLPSLITFVAEKHEEVKAKTQKQLDELLSEFEQLGESREALMDQEMLRTLVNFYKRNEFRESPLCRTVALAWTRSFLTFIGKDMQRSAVSTLDMWRTIYPKLVEHALVLLNDAEPEIQRLASVINTLLQDLVGHVLTDEESLTTLIATIVPQLSHKSPSTMSMTMDWLMLLMEKQPQSLAKASENILITTVKMLQELENVNLKKLLMLLSQMSKCYKGFFEKVIERVVQECSRTRIIVGNKIKHILMTFSDSYSRITPFTVFAQTITNRATENPAFYSELVEIMGDILTYEAGFYDVRAKLADFGSEEGKALFNVLYPAMCYSPSCAVLLCFLSQKYELAWLIIHKMAQMKVSKDTFMRLKSLAQKLELPTFMYIRLQMLNPENNFYLIRSLQALLMILPQEQAYFSLYNRLKCLSVPSVPLGKKDKETETEAKAKEVPAAEMKEWLRIFDETTIILNKLP